MQYKKIYVKTVSKSLSFIEFSIDIFLYVYNTISVRGLLMNYLNQLINELEKQYKLHKDEIFNYAIPESWNLYGYPSYRKLRSKELLVHPYEFYLFTLQNIFKNIKKENALKTANREWLKKASIYTMMVRCATAWDHDRDGRLPDNNLYHINDNGTFLKSILLLPTLKRMGINTILLHQIFSLSTTSEKHTYPVKEAVKNFRKIDESLKDHIVDSMSAKEQCAAFIEACHLLGIRVILEYCPGKSARDNDYLYQHPEWFYWIDADKINAYHPPKCPALAHNTIPDTYVLNDFYRSDDVKNHLALFQNSPEITETTLNDIEKKQHVTIAPFMVDQINADIPVEMDTTAFRFYEDFHIHTSKQIRKEAKPYLMQDSIRCDLHPGKKPIQELWDYLCSNIVWYQNELDIDGIYLEKTYLLPEKLQKEIAKTAHKQKRDFVIIAEDASSEHSLSWVQKGYDAISGNGPYEESDFWNFKFHTFSYRLKNNECPMFAACEAYDSRRIQSVEGKTGTIMLTIMNLFLPNGIPMMMNGAECFETQPLQLSEYGDQRYLYSLSKDDPRYFRQAYRDEYWFNYSHSDLSVLPDLLEKAAFIRQEYLHAITNPKTCIPVWFDSPRDYGIGFTFISETKALLAVCNTNVHNQEQLHIHTENLLCELPFKVSSIHQIFSTKDHFIHDIEMDSFQNILLLFEPGEVKLIELTSAA